MSKSKLFRYLALAFLAGVAFISWQLISWFIIYCLFLLAVVSFSLSKKKSNLRIIAYMLLFFILGTARFLLSEPIMDEQFIGKYNHETHTVSGKIAAYPDQRSNHQKLILKDLELEDKEEKTKGRLLLLTGLVASYEYGQELTFTCTLEKPKPFNDFAYDKYLARFHVYSLCAFPKDIEITEDNNSSFIASIFTVKDTFRTNITLGLSDPQAGLLAGLLLGERKGFGENLEKDFRRVGLTHIVALSGYNISILVGMFIIVSHQLYIPRRFRFILISLAILLFVLGTGASASVTRAGLMGWLVLLAYEFGRLAKPFNLLLAAAVIMTLINPKILRWDVGWQLSFLATYALLAFAPILNARFSKVPNHFGIREIFFVSISAILFTAPLIVWQFGGWSLIAPLANILVLPLIPLIMLLGLFVGLFGGHVFFSFLWVWPSWLLLSYVINISHLLSRLPISFIEIKSFPVWLLIISYMMIFYLMFYLKKRTHVSITA